MSAVLRANNLFGILMLLAWSWPSPGFSEESAAPAAEALQLVESLQTAFVGVAEQIRRSVVMVEVESDERNPELEALQELMPDLPPFRDPSSGTGSGFLVDANGTIFTNHHVVQGAQKIDILLSDGRRYPATLVGADPESDVAVIRMISPPDELKPAVLGDSESVRVGQFAIAVGSPMGFQNSFTVGHVSAKGRSNVGISSPGLAAPGFENLAYQDFLQVDTPINPGNSGGPLIDIHGRVIGINTAIIAGGGGGIGFSIPINMARSIADQLIAEGRVRRGWLGVQPRNLNNLESRQGVLQGAFIETVLPETPAARAGLMNNDIIIKLGKEPIRSSKDLLGVVANAPIGKELSCEVLRGEKPSEARRVQLLVTLEERPGPEQRRALTPTRPKSTEQPESNRLSEALGMELKQLNQRESRRLKRKHSGQGVLIAAVQPGSPAAAAGLQPDDVLLEVNRQRVNAPAQVYELIQQLERNFIPLAIERAGERHYLALERP